MADLKSVISYIFNILIIIQVKLVFSHMYTKYFQQCVEVIFCYPTIKHHRCFQHQLLCFIGWVQQMCVRSSFHLQPPCQCAFFPVLDLHHC